MLVAVAVDVVVVVVLVVVVDVNLNVDLVATVDVDVDVEQSILVSMETMASSGSTPRLYGPGPTKFRIFRMSKDATHSIASPRASL